MRKARRRPGRSRWEPSSSSRLAVRGHRQAPGESGQGGRPGAVQLDVVRDVLRDRLRLGSLGRDTCSSASCSSWAVATAVARMSASEVAIASVSERRVRRAAVSSVASRRRSQGRQDDRRPAAAVEGDARSRSGRGSETRSPERQEGGAGEDVDRPDPPLPDRGRELATASGRRSGETPGARIVRPYGNGRRRSPGRAAAARESDSPRSVATRPISRPKRSPPPERVAGRSRPEQKGSQGPQSQDGVGRPLPERRRPGRSSRRARAASPRPGHGRRSSTRLAGGAAPPPPAAHPGGERQRPPAERVGQQGVVGRAMEVMGRDQQERADEPAEQARSPRGGSRARG